jgi:superfamily II DNA or RNA helicase
MAFSAGSRVAARGLVWDVVAAENLGQQQRLQLRCAGGDLAGLAWDLLTPHEAVTQLHTELRPEETSPLQAWRLHHIACLLDQLPGPTALLADAPGRLTIEPYQLVPLMRALDMARPRLLLADGVGLGKTIQAGLIAVELIARRRAHRILVVTPAGPLLRQWDQELRQRFGLRFTTIADAASLQLERRRLELGGNPFDAVALCLTALDFAKQERVLEELERSSWDLVIIDEAHHCIGAGDDRDTTLRRRLAEVLARCSDGLLLLTATPHDGDDRHFGSLLALLDRSLVDADGLPAGQAYRRHVVRRLKQHVSDPATGCPLFRERVVIPVAVRVPPAADAVRAFHAALSALVTPRLGRAGGEALAFVSLLKRSVSTIAACVGTLRVVAERYGRTDMAEARERLRALRAYRRRVARYGVLEAADEAEAAELEAEDVAARLRAEEAVGLQRLIALGETAQAHDPKLAALLAEVRAIRAAWPRANILVYTEYADSQDVALVALRAAGLSGEILAISGQDDEAARSAAAERCAAADDVILVSTDSLAEGLNLHQRCCHLVHLDLPYNPNRLEQRNGRIDRYGQREAPQIRYLYLAGTFEEQLLLRLIAKYEKARAALTFMPETLGVSADRADWDVALVSGFAERQASLFEDAAPVIRTLDQTAEALEIDRAYDGFERVALRHGWLADVGQQTEAAQLEAADRAHRRCGKLLGCIDLAAFVRDSVAFETGLPVDGQVLHLPVDWVGGLDGLPGWDPVGRMLRLGTIGRAHPLVRRAISRMRQAVPVVSVALMRDGVTLGGMVRDGVVLGGVVSDGVVRAGAMRNGVAGVGAGANAGGVRAAGEAGTGDRPGGRTKGRGATWTASILVSYIAEMHGPSGLVWQRVLAVHLPRSGLAAEVLPDPTHWLHLGAGPASWPAAPASSCEARVVSEPGKSTGLQEHLGRGEPAVSCGHSVSYETTMPRGGSGTWGSSLLGETSEAREPSVLCDASVSCETTMPRGRSGTWGPSLLGETSEADQPHVSCPGLARAPMALSHAAPKVVGARAKPGHDTEGKQPHPSPTHPLTAHPSATRPVIADPSATHPFIARPFAARPFIADPSPTQPSAAHPSATHPSAARPSPTHPFIADPSATDPAAAHPTAAHPLIAEPCPAQPAAADISVWSRSFSAWAAPRLAEAEAVAVGLAERLAATLLADRRARAARDDADLGRWLRLRADALCGRTEARTPDLFADELPGLDWRSEPGPERRLTLYAADPGTPAASRREANELLALLQARREDQVRQLALSPCSVRPIGLLMLLPDMTRVRAATPRMAKPDARKTRTAEGGIAKPGIAKAGTHKTGAAKTGAAKAGTHKTGMAKPDARKTRTAEGGIAKPGIAKAGTRKTGTAKSGA